MAFNTAEEFFAAAKQRMEERPRVLVEINATYRIDLQVKSKDKTMIESWFIDAVNGDVRRVIGNVQADAVLAATKEDFDAIISGKLSMPIAMLRKKIVITGNAGAAMRLWKLS